MSIFQETPDSAGKMDEFRKYLNQFRCEKGVPYTHTSLAKGSYHIPADRMDEFHETYCRAKLKDTPLHITERPEDPSPLRADIDFRFGMGHEVVRVYRKEHVEKLVHAYFTVIADYIDVPSELRVAYVMEKPVPTEYRGKIKDGLHIVWPHIVVENSLMHLFRNHILDRAPVIFEGLPLCNTFEDVIDKAIIDKNNWLMYGSRKPESPYSYSVTHIYRYKDDGTLEEMPTPSAAEELTFVRLFSMRNKKHLVLPVRADRKDEVEQYIRHVLPSIDERRKGKLHMQIFGKTSNMTRNFVTEDDLIMARQLVSECLSPRRAENYEDWIKLGWTLRNIDFRLLDAWVEFSRVSSKYVEGECQSLWNRMRTDTLGMGTLRWWANNDNPIKYQDILSSNVMHLIDKCIKTDGAHFDVAKVVHAMYKDRYRFTVKDTWYMYKDDKHRWVRTREGLQLRMILSNEVCSKFMERMIYWNQEVGKSAGDEQKMDACQEKVKKLTKISMNLKSAGYKDSVMKECKALFTDEKFEELLDSHPHLVGFENGVYDLRMHEFRPGLPDDYISFSTGRHYIDYDATSVEAQDIHRYLAQVFTNANVRKFMMDTLACAMDGGIRQEKFYIFTGSGCHAKDTDIMMADGRCKKVQDIEIGDQLMGDDSKPRNVLQLFRGNAEMVRIIPTKGESFEVNEDHVLSLKFTNTATVIKRSDSVSDRWRTTWFELKNNKPVKVSRTFKSMTEAVEFKDNMLPTSAIKKGHIIDVMVKDLKTWGKWWWEKGNVCLYRPDRVQFSEKTVQLDPYMLGVWLGDGHSHNTRITTMDDEIVQYFKDHVPPEHDFHKVASNGSKASTYNVAYTGKRKRYECQNEILNGLRKYNLIMNKHIPDDYKFNSVDVRMKVLAGILDTDGSYQKHTRQYIISQKSERMIEDIQFVARSLGFACYKKQMQAKCCNNGKIGTYFTLNICGHGMTDIPCLLPRKKAEQRNKEKNVLLNSFRMENIGRDDYYGFELDGNHRYLMGDFTVTHNSNSKSALLNLVQKAIGDYYCIVPIALLTQKRASSNAAQSELERTKGRRLAVMQEPGENEKINIGLMKELSGGDRILVRGLFKEPIEFRPQFKMVMTCNELPEVPSDDGGTWRRIRVIEYTSKFTDKPDPKNPSEFPLDPDLLSKFDLWADTFISMILDHHKNMDPKDIHEPLEVRIATEGYKKNNDVIGQYISERMVKDETSTDRILLLKAFTDFRVWASQVTQKGKKLPDRNQFRTYMEKVFGVYPSDGKGWRGIRYLHAKGDGDDSDVE